MMSLAVTVMTMNKNPNATRFIEPRLGIDIGRVIISGVGHPSGADTAFFDGDEAAMLATPEVAGAVEAIGRLVELFDGRVWLVSKCGRRVQERTLRWLDGHDFYARTGLARDHVRFCVARADKRGHCVELGLTHFVDDRVDVHEAIHGTVRCQYLFGRTSDKAPGYVVRVASWPVLERFIRTTLTSPTTKRARPEDLPVG
jgi:hypothetical protein